MSTVAPLQLREFYVDKLVVETNADYSDDHDEARSDDRDMEITANVAKHPDKLDFMVTLGVSCTPKSVSAGTRFTRLEATIRGFFSLPDDTTQEVVDQLVPYNCFAIVYGLLRGAVAQATGMTVHGVQVLPTVNLLAALSGDDGGPEVTDAADSTNSPDDHDQ